MRPTVSDIAREAGVSLAAVGRAISARPGAREMTMSRVNATIRRPGHARDVLAANLARGRTGGTPVDAAQEPIRIGMAIPETPPAG